MSTGKTPDRDPLAEAFGHNVVSYIVLIGFCLITIILIALASQYNLPWLKTFAVMFGAFGFFFSKITLKQVLRMMADYPSMKAGSAFGHVFFGYVRLFYFVPLVGPLVTRFFLKPKSENPFTSPDEEDPA